MKGPRTALDVLTGPLAPFFPQPAFRTWLLCAAAMYGLTYGLNAEEQTFIAGCLGLPVDQLPTDAATRKVLIVGRRGGKTRYTAFEIVVAAFFRDYSAVLAAGERGVVMAISPDRRQSRVLFGYVAALIEQTPMLAALVESKTKDAIHLRNGISIEIHTASYRTTRGYTVVCAVLDESAFLPTDDSSEPDSELIAALVPAMATVPGAQLILISSPYARRGELWKAFAAHFGRPSAPVRVWRAPTRLMNPTVPQSLIDQAYADDPASAAAEYGAEFRTDVETFVSREVVDACVVPGRYELPWRRGFTYRAFTDPSGGSSDSMTLAIAHTEGNRIVVDLVRESLAPFSPDDVVKEFADTLRSYKISSVRGDKYGGEWPRERWRKHGLSYRLADKTKSDLYAALLPRLNAGTIELPDIDRATKQLLALERRTSRGGRDSIDHPPKGKDDVINAIAGVVHELRDGQNAIALLTVGEVESVREQLARCAVADAVRVREGTQDAYLNSQGARPAQNWRDQCFTRRNGRK